MPMFGFMSLGQQILRDAYQKRRAKNENFSLRAFSRWLKVSPAQISQMMSGKRPMTVKSVNKILPKLDLSPAEKHSLLESLFQKTNLENNGKTFEDSQAKQMKKILLLQEDKFRLVADWYHFAILALSRLRSKKSDPTWIARTLGIGVAEANLALQRLERLGIIVTKPHLKQICDPIEVVSEVPSEAIRKYHKQNLALAEEKLETIPNHLREFQSVSLVLNPRQLEEFRKLIDDMLDQAGKVQDANQRSRRNEPASDNKAEDEAVYNLNVQFFPISTLNETVMKENL
jgi:uncharacterized protein (TIGR02147 family)